MSERAKMRVADRVGGPAGESRETTQVEAAVSISQRPTMFQPDDAGILSIWAVAIAAAVVTSWLSRGTSFHQFTIGVLATLVCLLVVLTPIEITFRLLGALFSTQAPRDIDGAAPS